MKSQPPYGTKLRDGQAVTADPKPAISSGPAVSVIIPTYNGGRLILDAIESVLAQTFRDLEIIVVNDGSTDDTRKRLSRLAETGEIVYREQPNSGVSAARNAGLAIARGRYVSFLDHDDWWPPEKLEWQVRLLRERPEAVVAYGGFVMVHEDGGATRYVPRQQAQGHIHEELLRGCQLTSGSALIDADRLRRVGGFDEALETAEDWDMWLRLSKTGPFIYKPKVGLYYRLHGQNKTRAVLAHTKAHFKVARRHIGWNLRLWRSHLQCVSGYFVWHLHDFSREQRQEGAHGEAIKADVLALLFRPSLLLQYRFLKRLMRSVIRAFRIPFTHRDGPNCDSGVRRSG